MSLMAGPRTETADITGNVPVTPPVRVPALLCIVCGSCIGTGPSASGYSVVTTGKSTGTMEGWLSLG